MVAKKDLLDVLKTKDLDLLVTIGAGDIDLFWLQLRRC
jgi:hypothetical protein